MLNVPYDPNLTPGTWCQGGAPDNILFKCPNGHIGILDHDIADADGTVTPSVQCMEDGCEFHDFIRLEGWGKYA